MSEEDGDSEDDKVVLERLIGMKDEWLKLEAEIRNKAASLQSELNQQRKINDELLKQLDEARKSKENGDAISQLKSKDDQVETLTKENSLLTEKLQAFSIQNKKLADETTSDNMLLIDENEKLRTRLEEASAKIFAMEQLKTTINNNKAGDNNSANKKLIEEQQEEIKSLREELLMAKENASTNIPTANRTGHDSDVKELQNMLLEKTKEIVKKDEEIQTLKKEIVALEEEQDVLKSQNSALKEELNFRNEDNPILLGMTDELKRTKGKMQSLVDEIHKIKGENKELSERPGPLDAEERQLLELKLDNTIQVLMLKNKMLEDVIKDKEYSGVRRSSAPPDLEGKKKDEEIRKSDELLKRQQEEILKLQDKLAASFESEKNLLGQVQNLQHQTVAQLLTEQALKQQLMEARDAARARQTLEQQALSHSGSSDHSTSNSNSDDSASPPPIKDEAHVLSLQNKIYHLSLSLNEANAKIEETREKSNEDQARTAEELNTVLRERELHIVEMEREVEKYKDMEGSMWKFKALGGVMNELKAKHIATGAYDEGLDTNDNIYSRMEQGEDNESSSMVEPKEGRRGSKGEEQRRAAEGERGGRRGSDGTRDEVARRRVMELEGEVQALLRSTEELASQLHQTEEVDQAEINQLRKRVAELTRQQMDNNNTSEEWKEDRDNRKQKSPPGDKISRTVHEAALEMMRTIQREHSLEAERVGREFGEEKFRHQETYRKLQDATQTIAALRKKVKALTGSEYFEDFDDRSQDDSEVSEMQRLREAVGVAVAQVEEERKSLAREREAHVLTHSLLREERLRAVKDRDLMEEQLAASRRNLAEVVEEVLEAESIVIEKEKQVAAAGVRIKELEARVQTSPKLGSPQKAMPQPHPLSLSPSLPPSSSIPYSSSLPYPSSAPPQPTPAMQPPVLAPATKLNYVSSSTSSALPHHHPLPGEVHMQSQPSTHIPQMRTARTPADTQTLNTFSESNGLRFSHPYPAYTSPSPPPLTLSQIKTSHAMPPRLSQPFSSRPITSPQPTHQPHPPRATSPTLTPFPNFIHKKYPSFTFTHPSYPPTAAAPPAKTESFAKSDDPPKDKDELTALLSRTSQAIASKSTEMENIRMQLQATAQRLRVLQHDKEEIDAQRSFLRDGIDAFGKSISGNVQ